jgi:hypothetical protein
MVYPHVTYLGPAHPDPSQRGERATIRELDSRRLPAAALPFALRLQDVCPRCAATLRRIDNVNQEG